MSRDGIWKAVSEKCVAAVSVRYRDASSRAMRGCAFSLGMALMLDPSAAWSSCFIMGPFPGPVGETVLANGGNCSAPGNQLVDETYAGTNVSIRNANCEAQDDDLACEDPGDPTSICLEDPGVMAMINHVFCGGDSRVIARGAIEIRDTSRLEVSGGEFGRITTREGGSLGIFGGRGVDVVGFGDAQLEIGGGRIDRVRLQDGASVHVTGGFLEGVSALDESRAVVRGGRMRGSLYAKGGGLIEVVGTGFALDGELRGYGPVVSYWGTLTGILEDGTALEVDVTAGNDCSDPYASTGCADGVIRLVPEPSRSALAISALATLALLRRRSIW